MTTLAEIRARWTDVRHPDGCESCARPSTEAGRRILAQFHGWPGRPEYPWNLLDANDILTIEDEARAAAARVDEGLRKAAQALLETWDLVYCVEYIRGIDDATLAETGDLLDDRISALRVALGAREDTGTVSVTPDGHLLYSADPAEGGPA